MKKITLFIIIILSTVGSVLAAPVTFVMRAPSVVAAGERFRIEFILSNAGAEKFNPPSFTGLDVLAGPVVSTGTIVEIVNGKQTQSSSFTYTYTVEATAKGKATISASSVVADNGKSYSTNATSIEIASGQGGQGSGTSSRGGGGSAKLTNESILLKMEVNKSDVYKGEAVVASLRLYTQVGIAGFEEAKLPAFNGFWKQELDMTQSQSSRATVGGKVYESQILKQWLIYPQRTGAMEIEQSDFTVVAQVVTQTDPTGSLFDNFFGGGQSVENVKRKLIAPAVKIRVKELPQPMPANFSGGVGKFTLTSEISSKEVTANSGGSVILKLSGAGDFPLIDAPVIEMPSGFEKYDTKQTEQITNTTAGTTGSRTWEYPFIARAEGDFTIASTTMSYFDPTQGKYVELRTNDFTIKVLHDTNPGSTAGAIVSGVTKEDLKMLGQDVRYIHTQKLNMVKRGNLFLWSITFFISLILIALAFAAMLLLLKKRISNRADVVRTKNKKANSVALRRLKKAKGYMNSGNETGFYEEMLRALWGYMGDKLAISVSDLNKERLREEFVKRGVDEQNGEEFLNLISECEMAQYSPSGSIQISSAYQAALDLIGKLELK